MSPAPGCGLNLRPSPPSGDSQEPLENVGGKQAQVSAQGRRGRARPKTGSLDSGKGQEALVWPTLQLPGTSRRGPALAPPRSLCASVPAGPRAPQAELPCTGAWTNPHPLTTRTPSWLRIFSTATHTADSDGGDEGLSHQVVFLPEAAAARPPTPTGLPNQPSSLDSISQTAQPRQTWSQTPGQNGDSTVCSSRAPVPWGCQPALRLVRPSAASALMQMGTRRTGPSQRPAPTTGPTTP